MQGFGALLAAMGLAACGAAPQPGDIDRTELTLAALADNIAVTDLSAHVRVTDHRVYKDRTVRSGNENVLAIEHRAKVIETYRGTDLQQLTYLQFVDREERLDGFSPGEVIVSLCRDEEAGYYYLPDIGFEVPSKVELIERAREVARTLGIRDPDGGPMGGAACR